MPDALLAIFGMALVTFGIKAGGLLLASRLPKDGFVAAWLRYIPGAVLASLIAPAIAAGGVAEAIGAVATAAAYLLTRSLFPAMIAGVGAVWLLRSVLGG